MSIKCFHCNHKLKKTEVWRNLLGYPVCKDCLNNDLEDYDDTKDWIIDSIDNDKYKRNYQKFYYNLIYVDCPKCHCDIMTPKDDLINTNQFSCPECYSFLDVNEEGNVTRWAKDEDEFVEKYPDYLQSLKKDTLVK